MKNGPTRVGMSLCLARRRRPTRRAIPIGEILEESKFTLIGMTTHDVVMAENLPAESYLDTGNRSAFEGVMMDIHPRFSGLDALEIWQRHACARQVRHGPELTRVLQRLEGIAGAIAAVG